MGRLVESLASGHDCHVVGVITSLEGTSALAARDFGAVDVAVDFSHGSVVRANLEAMAGRKWNVVIGTTGWAQDADACRAIAQKAGIGVLASANFSLGMHLFRIVVQEAARRFDGLPDVGAWIHETHHVAKKDAPSGTALLLKSAMELAGYSRRIDVSSTRAGSVPGTHEIGFDAPAETVTLTHTVRDRAVFAHGAIAAAKWLKGRHGWFSIADMLTSGPE
jgi:4-hydroxy-tetrahydrodipicolinate reductase